MGCSLKIQKIQDASGGCVARDPETSGGDRRGATGLPEKQTRRTLTCSSVSLNFPTSPLVKSHPGRWSSNCVGFRGLGPTTSEPKCEDRDVAPGRLGPTTPRFTRIASSARGRARREPRVPRRASRVARNGKPERRAFPTGRGSQLVPKLRYHNAATTLGKHPASKSARERHSAPRVSRSECAVGHATPGRVAMAGASDRRRQGARGDFAEDGSSSRGGTSAGDSDELMYNHGVGVAGDVSETDVSDEEWDEERGGFGEAYGTCGAANATSSPRR